MLVVCLAICAFSSLAVCCRAQENPLGDVVTPTPPPPPKTPEAGILSTLTNYFKATLEGIDLSKLDLVVMAEAMPGVWDFGALPSGCLIVLEPTWGLSEPPAPALCKKIYGGDIPIWRKQ